MTENEYIEKNKETLRIAQLIQDIVSTQTEDGMSGICGAFCAASICAVDNKMNKKDLINILSKVFDYVRKNLRPE